VCALLFAYAAGSVQQLICSPNLRTAWSLMGARHGATAAIWWPAPARVSIERFPPKMNSDARLTTEGTA